MGASEKLVWKIYASAVGAATTLLAQKLVSGAWKAATGDNPPDANNPHVPLHEAIIWAIASGLGVGMAQLVMNRYMAGRWEMKMGHRAPGKLRTKLD